MIRPAVALLLGAFLIGCADESAPTNEPESDFVPYQAPAGGEQGGPGGPGSAVFDPCLGPRCERPNWEGRDSIVDPLTDLAAAPHITEQLQPDISH